jgi:HPt (histidine-containing phosphotransfer) domain-containing protein
MMHDKMSYFPYTLTIAISVLSLVNSGAPMSTQPTLNSEAIQALRELSPDGDGAFLKELIEIYLTDTPKLITQLEDGLAREDATLVVRASHTIKGSSGNFGAEEFARLAKEIESHGKTGNLPAAAALVPEFKHQFEKVAGALKQLATA